MRELKARASEYIREAKAGGGVVIVSHGKPTAALIPLTEDSLEDFLFETSPRLKAMIEDSFSGHKPGERVSVESMIGKTRRELKRNK